MGYVWTPQQIESYESYYREVPYHFSGVNVAFTTTPEFVRSVLPPCLEPASEPKGIIMISAGRESWRGDFTIEEEETGGGVWLYAVHDGVEGLYALTVIVNGDMNAATGREAWGMPKKRGEVGLFHDGEQLYAFAERRGVRVIEVAAMIGREIQPFEEEGALLELKGWIAPDGNGLQDDPALVVFGTHTSYKWVRQADAQVRLTGTIEDPVGDIPVVSVDEATYCAGTELVELRDRVVLSDRNVYRPYIYGRLYDDWTARIKATPNALVAPQRQEA